MMENNDGRLNGLSSFGSSQQAVSPVPASIPDAKWWYTQNEEYLAGCRDTREEAIAAGIEEYCGEPFKICKGSRFRYKAIAFDIGMIAEQFDDDNMDYAGEDNYPSEAWSTEACHELERELGAVMDAWLDRHGYRDAWAIDTGPYETIPAQGMSAFGQDGNRLEAKPASPVACDAPDMGIPMSPNTSGDSQ